MTSRSLDCVLLFPGQGSQRAGMGRDLLAQFQEFRAVVEEASDVLHDDMARLMADDPDGKLNLTRYTQPALLTFSHAVHRTLARRVGLKAELVAGHSLGEYSALVAIGALSFADALKAVRFRGFSMQRVAPVGAGAMAACMGELPDALVEVCRSVSTDDAFVEVANFNSPRQVVISGHATAVERALAEISRRKLGKTVKLPVSAPFHSRIMHGAAADMQQYLKTVPLRPFTARIAANVDGTLHGSRTYHKAMMASQVERPVLWSRCVEALADAAPRECTWIEVGPGQVLSDLVRQILPRTRVFRSGDVKAVRQLLDHLGGDRSLQLS